MTVAQYRKELKKGRILDLGLIIGVAMMILTCISMVR